MCCTKNGLTYDGGKRRRGSRTGDCGEMTGTDLGDRARISWDLERRETLSLRAPCPRPDRLEPLGFPPPWPTRPWIYSNLITSRNGIQRTRPS